MFNGGIISFFLGLVITGKQSQCSCFYVIRRVRLLLVEGERQRETERVKCLVLCSLAYFLLTGQSYGACVSFIGDFLDLSPN